MEIISKDPADLRGYDRNPRMHSPAQIDQIAASISEFGFNVPILIDDTDMIIAGHGRLAAALQLRLPTVPCILIEHLSEEQRRAYILADNRLSDISFFDDDKLGDELAALVELGAPLIGFDDFSFDDISVEKASLKKIDLAAPEMAWVLVGIPVVRFGEIQDAIDGLANVPGVAVHTTVSGK
ncbi:MAG: ParB/Srx family N-terminal domain-containing protein [Desulfobulbaceae bacterium]|jgi:hypothetical protein|nr:ParB/Srx family N-terminal domain-containing protein [Desulfobulbaceae bacterium]